MDGASQQKKILEQLDGDQAGSPQVRATSVLQALKKVAERCDMASTVKEVLEVTPRGEGGKGGWVWPPARWTGMAQSLAECVTVLCSSHCPGAGSPKEAPAADGSPKAPPRSGSTNVEEVTQMMDALRLDKRDLMRRLEVAQREKMLMGESLSCVMAALTVT